MKYWLNARPRNGNGEAPYFERFKSLSSYARTLDYYRIMFKEGPYRQDCLEGRNDSNVELIDQVNYSKHNFDEPLRLKDLLDGFGLEAGYGVPDGSHELGPFIKHLEMSRADHFAASHPGDWGLGYREAISNSTVGVGHGVTGALTNVIGSIVKTRRKYSTNIVIVAPNYCIAEDIAHFYGLKARILQCTAQSRFLPESSELKNLCDDGTAAICLTVPTNPSHDAWSSDEAESIVNLIRWCQEREVFFVLDAIFQDLVHGDQVMLEPFVLAGSDYCILKLFGPSKDRPMACGHRVGYYIGDRRIADAAYQLSHITLNSPNAYSKMWFAFDLLFRTAMIQNRDLTLDDCTLFSGSFLFGEYFQDIGARIIWEVIREKRLFERYTAGVDETRAKIRSTMEGVCERLLQYPCFMTRELPKFGNSLFIQVSPEFYKGNDHKFFWDVLTKTNVGILVGNAFGLTFPSDDIWFRVTCVAEEADTLLERVSRIARLLKTN